MIIWTPTVLSVLYARVSVVVVFFCFFFVLFFCICTCSAQLSMFHMERRSRNTLIIIIINPHPNPARHTKLKSAYATLTKGQLKAGVMLWCYTRPGEARNEVRPRVRRRLFTREVEANSKGAVFHLRIKLSPRLMLFKGKHDQEVFLEAGWLVGMLVGWLAGWLVGQLVDWPVA